MENVAELPGKALSSEFEPSDKPEEPPITASEPPREHIRAPELHRRGTMLFMVFTAVVGAIAGARLAFWGGSLSESAINAISQALSSSFGEVFLRQTLIGAAFLVFEFLLGFSALGDLLVWAAPFLCAMGGAMQFTTGLPLVIAGAVVRIAAVTAGAVCSAEMSGLLLRSSRGGTVHMGTNPRKSFVLKVMSCFAAAVLSALLAGI